MPNTTARPIEVSIPRRLIPTQMHLNAISKLMEGRAELEKLHHQFLLYSIRANRGARIILTKDADGSFKVLAFFDRHQYNRLKLIKKPDINHSILDLEQDTAESQTIKQALEEVQNPKDANYWRKGHFINRQAVFFNDLQEQVLTHEQLPLVVTGVAGSGKTLLIIKMLINAHLAGVQNLVYLAPTRNLAQHAQQLFAEQLAQQDAPQPREQLPVSFLSAEEFINLHKPQDKVLAPQQAVIEWLTHYNTQNKLHKKILSQPARVFEEFKIISVLTKEAYLKTGAQQSLFKSKEEKEACFTLYEIYGNKHKNQCQMAFPELKPANAQYELLIIDEGQTFTIKQHQAILSCALNGRFLVVGDPLQNFNNKISVFPQLKQWICDTHKIQDPFISLPYTYRNPLPVVNLARNIAWIRRLLMGGIAERWETIDLIAPTADDPDALPVTWLETIDEAQKAELTKMLNQPDTLVITGSEQHKQQVLKEFNSPTTLFVHQSQGLEATTVFVYCLFTAELIKKINRYLQGINCEQDYKHLAKDKKGTHEFTNDLNSLFTAVTRVTQTKGRLIIYFGESIPKRDCQKFFALLTKDLTKAQPTSVTPEPEEASEVEPQIDHEQWQNWVKKLYVSGNEDAAYQAFCKHTNGGMREFNALIGKPMTENQETAPKPNLASPPKSANPKTRTQRSKAKQSKPATETQKYSNFFKDASPTQTTVKQAAPTEEEVHNNYLNGLLKQFNGANIKNCLAHKKAEVLLFNPFTLKEDNSQTTLYRCIVNDVKRLGELNQIFRSHPYLATGNILKSGEIITELLTALETVNSRFSIETNYDLCVTLSNHANELIVLLKLLITNQPILHQFITIERLSEHLFSTLINTDRHLLHRLIQLNPTLFIDFIDLLTNHIPDWTWCIPLMKSQIGADILVKLYELNPKLVSLFSLSKLKAHSLTPPPPLEQGHQAKPPLFFWLSTTTSGQNLIAQLCAVESIEAEALNQPIVCSDPHYNGTTTEFWLKSNTDKLPAYYTGLNYPGRFQATDEAESLIHFITAEALTVTTLDGQINALFKSPNLEALLFDYVNGASHTLFARITAALALDFLMSCFNTFPELYKIFTPRRLNQGMTYTNMEGKHYIETVFYTLVKQRPRFLNELMKCHPGVKPALNAGLFIKSSFIYPAKNITSSILDWLVSARRATIPLSSLGAAILTPEFAVALFTIKVPGLDYTGPFFNLIYKQIDEAVKLFDTYPAMLHYFTAEHLALFPYGPPTGAYNRKVVHYLWESSPGRGLFRKLINLKIELLSGLTTQDLMVQHSSGSSFLRLFHASDSDYMTLVTMIRIYPELFRALSFSDLLEEMQVAGQKGTFFERLCMIYQEQPDLLFCLMGSENFVKSIDPEMIINSPNIFYYLSDSIEGIKVMETICDAHPQIIDQMTVNSLYGLRTVATGKADSLFQKLHKLLSVQYGLGMNNFLKTAFERNPALIKSTGKSKATLQLQMQTAMQLDIKHRLNGSFFKPRSSEQVSNEHSLTPSPKS